MGGDYYWYKSHGICTDCHANNAEKGHTRCLDCRLKALDRAAERRCKMTEQDIEKRRNQRHIYAITRYHKLKESGMCVDCGKREAVNGVRCKSCRLMNNWRRRKWLDYCKE